MSEDFHTLLKRISVKYDFTLDNVDFEEYTLLPIYLYTTGLLPDMYHC